MSFLFFYLFLLNSPVSVCYCITDFLHLFLMKCLLFYHTENRVQIFFCAKIKHLSSSLCERLFWSTMSTMEADEPSHICSVKVSVSQTVEATADKTQHVCTEFGWTVCLRSQLLTCWELLKFCLLSTGLKAGLFVYRAVDRCSFNPCADITVGGNMKLLKMSLQSKKNLLGIIHCTMPYTSSFVEN